MPVLKFAPKPQETEAMPTLNDLYQLAKSTDARLDAMDRKLEAVESEVREGIRALLETFSPQAD